MGLTITVLGPPHVSVDGAPLRVDTRKAVALLAFLALSGRAHPRDELVDLLWPDLDAGRGRATLRRTLSSLRSGLGGRWLVADGATVRLALADVDLDVARFRAAAASAASAADPTGPLQLAAALYRDDLLVGFSLRDSITFDDWLQASARQLRRELEGVLDRLADALGAAGETDEAIAVVRRRLALDPLFEPGHRALIGLLAASGRRADALVAYRGCVRLLDRELGVRPLAATTAVYDAVSEGLPVGWPAPELRRRPAGLAASGEPLPFVGRRRELAALRDAHAAAVRVGSAFLVVGEAGIGKTRLLDELERSVHAAGGPVIRGRCFEGEATLPFGVVAALLRGPLEGSTSLAALPEHWLGELTRIVPGLAPATPAAFTPGPAGEHRLHEAIVAALASAGGGEPLLVVIDDVHHADAASIAALAFLARRIEQHRVLLVGTLRGEEAGATLAALQRATARLRLDRLGAAAVADLLEQVGAADDVELVLDRTGGVPLLLAEYLRAGGARVQDAPGRGIGEWLAERIEGASEAAGQILTAAAVIGTRFDIELVRAASGRSDEEVVAGLEELLGRGLIVEDGDAYRFAHERLREVVDRRTSLARRRLLHRRVADELARRRDDPSRIASHLLAGGLEERAADAFVLAGERARALGATSEALEAFRTAIALGHPDPVLLEGVVGEVLAVRGEYPGAIAAFERALAGAGPKRIADLEHRLGRVHERRGDHRRAAHHLDEALRVGGSTARLQADRGLVARRSGDIEGGVRLVREACMLAELAGDREAFAQALSLLGMATQDVAALERSVSLAATLPDRAVLVGAQNNLALVVGRLGDGERAAALTLAALETCVAIGDRHREAALENNLADLHHRAGRDAESMAHLKRAVSLFAEIGFAADPEPEIWMLVDW